MFLDIVSVKNRGVDNVREVGDVASDFSSDENRF